MNRNFTILTIILLLASFSLQGQSRGLHFAVSGQITDTNSGEELVGVGVNVKGTGIWTVSDDKGFFTLEGIDGGKVTLLFACLGYADRELEFTLSRDIEGMKVKLAPNTLALKTVVVTAQRDRDGLNTSLQFGSKALEHMQMSNITDIAALLPGGKTVNPDLTSDNIITLRGSGSSAGNAAFGTAVEVDGVRIGGNASFGTMSGASTRSISTENVQSIEVITGVPSAEYGDLNSGMVRIHTKKGVTPVNITFSANPRTWLTSASKGIDLQKNRGILNLSAEWTRATQKLSSPYTSYTRRGISATYTNTFAGDLHLDSGLSANIGGMNSENDPDAYVGTYSKGRDNALRAHANLTWAVRKPWITNLNFESSVNFQDNLTRTRDYSSSASTLPAVHSTLAGYHLADRLPKSYFSDLAVDSRELDLAASLKYEWFRKWNDLSSKFKAGVQWKANGNVGKGEYYTDPTVSANGFRPRDYSEYPFMHNLSLYAEENLTLPIGATSLEIMAGLRMENLFVKGTQYRDISSLSPRFNARWKISEDLSVRAGWGISEKLPSYYILFPVQKYRDILTFSFSHGEDASYVYYTQPYRTLYNEDLTWQKSYNTELGLDFNIGQTSVSLVGYYNLTRDPYTLQSVYTPLSYSISTLPSGYKVPSDPQIRVDSQTGTVYLRGGDSDFWTAMETLVTDRTFFESQMPSNGTDIHRAGAELTVDFPQIEPLSTSIRLDAAYAYSYYADETLSYLYRSGSSHTSLPNRSYQYIGIYANGANTSYTFNGKQTHSLNANLTAITHIPQARLIITCRLETSLLQRSRNLSVYQGAEYAYNVSADGTQPTGGSIYDANGYTAIRPIKYMDTDGQIHDFTDAEAALPEFSNLIIKSGNAYTFARDGYGFYCSANLSITKEIGDKVSLSFFANNFTNSRMYVKSMATGVGAIFTPSFYYGLTCRIKI